MIETTDEIEQSCKYIGRIRKYNRVNFKTKNIGIYLGCEDGVTLYSNLVVRCNERTGTTSFSVFSLKIVFKHNGKWKRNSISPTTNKRLICTNQHALETLRRQRQYVKEKIKGVSFYTYIEKNAHLRERILYNTASGNVTISTVWAGW